MIKVSAKQTTMNVGPQKGTDRFVLMAQTYNTLSETKVINEASLRTGLSKSVVRACWEGCGDVISAWCVEGHSCPIPGLGHMRFGIRATSVEKVEDVSSHLITSRRVIFTPSVDIKDELAKTNISITCYDKDGMKIKTVTSSDTNDIEDEDGDNASDGSETRGEGSGSESDPDSGSSSGSSSDNGSGLEGE